MRRLLTILLWSVIAAAFIGPGTVTTATVAGARFGYVLLWALGFSVIATIVLVILSGLILKRTAKELFVREAPDKTTRVARANVDVIRPGRVSAMPEQLLQNLTAQEAADLIAWLRSLR